MRLRANSERKTMKLQTLSESLAAVWIAVTEALEPHQRVKAGLALAHIHDDGVTDPLARCLVEQLIEDVAEELAADSSPPLVPAWHETLATEYAN
jgi:hypothetical protein